MTLEIILRAVFGARARASGSSELRGELRRLLDMLTNPQMGGVPGR